MIGLTRFRVGLVAKGVFAFSRLPPCFSAAMEAAMAIQLLHVDYQIELFGKADVFPWHLVEGDWAKFLTHSWRPPIGMDFSFHNYIAF